MYRIIIEYEGWHFGEKSDIERKLHFNEILVELLKISLTGGSTALS